MDADGQRIAVADFVVLYRVFHQHLYGHRRYLALQEFLRDVDVKVQVVFVAHLQQVKVRMYEIHFFVQRHGVRQVVVQRVAHHPRQFLQIVLSFVGRFAYQGIQRVERIEKHVRIELAFQGFVLVDEVFRTQLLVFEQHASATLVLVVQIAGTGDDAGYQDISQWMQVVMQHGRDGGHFEMLVDVDKTFPQQVAHNQCDHECKGDPFPAQFPGRVVGHHHSDVQEEEQQNGKIGEQDFVTYIGPMDVREQMAARFGVGQRNQFGQVHEERHQDSDGVQHQQESFMDVKQLHAAKLVFFIRNLGRYIHSRPEIRTCLCDTGVHFDGSVHVVYHLVYRNQFGREGTVGHTVDLERKAAARQEFVQIFFVGSQLQHGRTLVDDVAYRFACRIVFAGVDVHVGHVAVAWSPYFKVSADTFLI